MHTTHEHRYVLLAEKIGYPPGVMSAPDDQPQILPLSPGDSGLNLSHLVRPDDDREFPLQDGYHGFPPLIDVVVRNIPAPFGQLCVHVGAGITKSTFEHLQGTVTFRYRTRRY